jgi:TonB-dependent starch-binding outer membrane protein SusC
MTGDFFVRKSLGGNPSSWRAIVTGLFLFVLTALAAPSAQAQTGGRILGTVTDAQSGQALSEVQVYIPGTGLGALTRANGRFIILNVPAGTHQVKAERIGLTSQTQSVTVAGTDAAEVNFLLSTQALGLDEIVVTGTAGAARRREVGSTVNSINVGALNEKPTDVTKLLQATAPGVDVTQGGGGAGQGSKIRLRGANTLSNGGDPIIYVDGVRMMTGAFQNRAAKDQSNRAANVTQSPLDMINPNDIDRIEVIKGSAATTLYGTDASNGVIQIFTKKGSTGAPVWSFETLQGTAWNQRFGYGDVQAGKVVNGQIVPFENSGTSKYIYMEPWICTGPFKCGVFQTTPHTQTYSASVRGGGGNLQYFTSGEFYDDHGNTPNDFLDRKAARSNFTFAPFTELQMQWNTAYSNQNQTNTPQGNNAEGLELNVFRQNQNYFASGDPELINQVLGQSLAQQIERFTTGGTATYSPLADLTNRFTIGYDFSNHETRNIRPFGFYAHPEGIIYVGDFQKRILTFDYVGSYAFNVLSNVKSSFSWGGQAVGDDSRLVEGNGSGFPGASVPTVNSAAASRGYEERSRIWTAGFFFQDVFDINNKYFLTLGTRVDGNSAFGSGFGLQVYPKASVSWVASDESFWNDAWGNVKMRAAYGKAGRAPGAFDAIRTWENTPIVGVPAFIPKQVGSPDLGPEVTTEIEGGLDASWMEDRVRTAFTYYRQKTNDALMNVRPMPSTGFTLNQLTNVGTIKNWGTETSLDVSALRSENYGVDVNLAFSTNKSLVESHSEPINVGKSISWSNTTVIVHPEVLTKTSADVPVCTDAIKANPAKACRDTNQYVGPNLPTRTLAGGITLRVPGNITLSTRGEFRGGNFVSSLNPMATGRSVRSPLCMPYYANNEDATIKNDGSVPAIWMARCTPSLATGYNISGDYFKMRTLTATVPMDFAFPDRVSSSTLTLSLNNFYTWSKDSWWGTYGFENFGNDGIGEAGLGATGISGNERLPAPTTLRASLRVTF